MGGVTSECPSELSSPTSYVCTFSSRSEESFDRFSPAKADAAFLDFSEGDTACCLGVRVIDLNLVTFRAVSQVSLSIPEV